MMITDYHPECDECGEPTPNRPDADMEILCDGCTAAKEDFYRIATDVFRARLDPSEPLKLIDDSFLNQP